MWEQKSGGEFMLTQQKAKTSFSNVQPQLHKSTIVPEQEEKWHYWDVTYYYVDTLQLINVKASEATHANSNDGTVLLMVL